MNKHSKKDLSAYLEALNYVLSMVRYERESKPNLLPAAKSMLHAIEIHVKAEKSRALRGERGGPITSLEGDGHPFCIKEN